VDVDVIEMCVVRVDGHVDVYLTSESSRAATRTPDLFLPGAGIGRAKPETLIVVPERSRAESCGSLKLAT
jgi:hypothetical protein